ncbi:MAG: hypothetical protein ACK4S2_15645, partial [Gemmobacter sp.]
MTRRIFSSCARRRQTLDTASPKRRGRKKPLGRDAEARLHLGKAVGLAHGFWVGSVVFVLVRA